MNADIEDAIEDGVVVICAAGNDNYYIAEEGDPEWNNKLNIQGLGGWVYMNRGGSPSELVVLLMLDHYNQIIIGDLHSQITDQELMSLLLEVTSIQRLIIKGTKIQSILRELEIILASISGTSMASPQVCGLIALAASGKERFTQMLDAIAIIDRFGKAGDITFDVES